MKYRKQKELLLRENQLTQLNEKIGTMANLEVLDVWANSISSIPSSIGNLKKLRIINASRNQLSSIPLEIGFLGDSLRKVLLARNNITQLPGELMFLHPSCELDLSQNNLKVNPQPLFLLKNNNN